MNTILPHEIINIILIFTITNGTVLMIPNLLTICKQWRDIIYTKKIIIFNKQCLPFDTKIHDFVMNKEYKNIWYYVNKNSIDSIIFIKYMPLHNKNPSKLFLYIARKLYFENDIDKKNILAEFRINVETINYVFTPTGPMNWTNSIYNIYYAFKNNFTEFRKYILFCNYFHDPMNTVTLHLMLKYLNNNEKNILEQLYADENNIEYLKKYYVKVIPYNA